MPAPAGYIRLGIIGYVDKGDYSSTAVYTKNQVVHYEEKSYYCKVDGTTAKAPTNKNYWGVMAAGGASLLKTKSLSYVPNEFYIPDVIFETEQIIPES